MPDLVPAEFRAFVELGGHAGHLATMVFRPRAPTGSARAGTSRRPSPPRRRGRAPRWLPRTSASAPRLARKFATLADRHRRLLGAGVVAVLAGEAVVDEPGEDRAQVGVVERARRAASRRPRRSPRVQRARAASSASPPSPATALCSCSTVVVERARRVGRVDAPHDLPQHQQVRVVEADRARPRARHARLPARARDIGWWQAWQSNTHELREQPVAAALRVEHHVELLLGRERLADGPHAHAVPAALALLASPRRRRSAAAASAVKVSSSKLMRGCPAPMMRWVTNLSLLPKWQDRHSARERHRVLGRVEPVRSRSPRAWRRARRAT